MRSKISWRSHRLCMVTSLALEKNAVGMAACRRKAFYDWEKRRLVVTAEDGMI